MPPKHPKLPKLPILPTFDSADAGYFDLPEDHAPVIFVPKNGARCSTCKWVSADKKRCGNTLFADWMGTDELPGPADSVCSDWWEPDI